MRSHILREISENKLDPKKAYVLGKGKLVEKKKQSVLVSSEHSVTEMKIVETEIVPQEVMTPSQDVDVAVAEEISVATASIEEVTDRIDEEIKLTTESVVEDKKKKSNFFKKKQSLVQ